MATDWAADVKKYAPNADDGVIAGIVRYCGIALRKVDSSLVAFSDKKETDRVRENFLKKKLGLTQADKTLDAAIAKVGETMKADRTKNRVTVYYLLADNFKKLDMFAPKAKAAAKAPAKKPAAKAAGTAALAGAAGLAAASAAKAPAKKKAAPAKKAAVVATTKKATTKKVAIKAAAAPQGLMDKVAGAGTAAVVGTAAAAGVVAAGAASAATSVADAAKDAAAKTVDVARASVAGATGLAASAAGTAGSVVSGAAASLSGTDDEDSGLGWLLWLLFAALVAFVLWWVFMRGSPDEAAAPAAATTAAAAPAAASAAADLSAAPVEGTVEIPTGAGVTSELRDGKPVVKVYFDTAKTDLAPAFSGAAGGLKGWLEANAGSSLAISGYSDPSGNAAANAELAKNRAQAVQAALVAAGIAESSALLVKPEVSADATVPPEAARRVEVVVK